MVPLETSLISSCFLHWFFMLHHGFLHVLPTDVFSAFLGLLRKIVAMGPMLLLLGLAVLIAPSASYSCYGDISTLQAPVISCTPVRAPDCGMDAVKKTAEVDIVRLRKYEVPIKRVARNLCLDPALIAAIISQESRVGLLLNNGWDQGRRKFGLMQIDRQHDSLYGTWDSEEHINQCSNILVVAINEVRARHPTWTWEQQLRGGICAYRSKIGNVQVYDEDPCHRDNYYVDNVIRRAQYFKRHGF
nr:PREDICTED: lysozyme g-like [Apteryx mantelli mantelli]